MNWVKLRSWHRIALMSRGGQLITRCGRSAPRDSATSAELPMGDKSCESCLRVIAREKHV